MQVKKCENIPDYKGRYSPPTFIGAESFVQWGDPDADHISTSFVERRNLSIRMGQQHSRPAARTAHVRAEVCG